MNIWIYGEPFSGKTKFACEFPNHVVLSTDGNARRYTDSVIDINSLEDMQEAVKHLSKYDTVIVDVLEYLYSMVRTYYLEKLGIDHESDAGFAKAWQMIREGFWSILDNVLSIKGKDIILLSHLDEYTEKTSLGQEITWYRPSVTEKLHSKISGKMSLVGRAYKQLTTSSTGQRLDYLISVGGYATELSGDRLGLKKRIFKNSYEEFKNNIGA